MGEYTKAEHLLGHVVKVEGVKQGDSNRLAAWLGDLARLYLALGQLDKAEALADEACGSSIPSLALMIPGPWTPSCIWASSPAI